ncbi:MAG: sigma-E processing peptidase SpoIIGA [Defluviitaleaceae bacterium]|nr:sigma-E processing peptidase SpoIIGA [Defluviitaleaceae bacterium]
MEIDVYADVVFLINFLMDWLILWCAGKLARRKARFPRLLAGGAVMSLAYCLLVFFAPYNVFLNIAASLLILTAGAFAAFGRQKIRNFAKLILFSYITAFMLGGLGMALFYNSGVAGLLSAVTGSSAGIFSVKVLIASVCGFYVLFRLGYIWFERRAMKRRICLDVKIFCDGSCAKLCALVDTGHSLRDPLSSCPVIVAEAECLKCFIPDGLSNDDLSEVVKAAENTGLKGRLRMIPFESLGRQHGMLVGFRPDMVEITRDKDTFSIRDVIIGIYGPRLSKDGAYQGLLSPEMIQD